MSPELFSRIKFSSKKKAKELEIFNVSSEIIKEAWETLSKNGKHAESLMIYLMFAFELSSWCKITKVWRYCNEKQTDYD